MFQATLDTVAYQLIDAKKTTRHAIAELSTITGLTWQSHAGRAFVEQVDQLSIRLQRLTMVLSDAEHYLAAARKEIAVLEAQMNAQRLAG